MPSERGPKNVIAHQPALGEPLHNLLVEGFWNDLESSDPLSWITRESLSPPEPTGLEKFRYYSALLEAISPGLFLALTLSPGKPEITITANGNPSLFPDARRIAEAAPTSLLGVVDVYALRRPQGFVSAIHIAGEVLDGETVRYRAKAHGGLLDVTLYVPGFISLQNTASENLAGASFLLLDHALGEYEVATRFGGIHFAPRAKAGPQDQPLRLIVEELETT